MNAAQVSTFIPSLTADLTPGGSADFPPESVLPSGPFFAAGEQA